MGGSGGGGDGGMGMMMMMMQMQQMEQQRKQQEEQQKQQMFQSSQRAENQNYQRYQDLIKSQNTKVGDQWDLYNQNIGKIRKLNPQYNAHSEYTFDPYKVNGEYHLSRNLDEANANVDNLNKWYGETDARSLADYNFAKKNYDESKKWLADAQATADSANRIVPGALPGAWGAGGGNVSGGAGADSQQKPATQAGNDVGGAGLGDVFSGFGSSGTAAPQAAGTGMIGNDPAKQNGNSLASVFVGATNPSKASAGSQIF